MDTAWFYAHEGTKKGPVSRDDLQRALLRGEVDRQTLVWCKAMPQWQALESVEELRPLLEHVPPPLPPEPPAVAPEPPPLPPPAPAAPPAAGSGSAAAPSRERPAGQGDGPQTGRRPAGEGRALLVDWFSSTTKWLADKIGHALWVKIFGQPAAVYVLISGLVAGGFYTVIVVRPEKSPVAAATGRVRIDANPWGEVRWIRGPQGNVALPEAKTTPLVLTLPAGSYQARVDYPQTRASEVCDLTVQPDRVATCWLDLAPVDAESYFQRIGW